MSVGRLPRKFLGDKRLTPAWKVVYAHLWSIGGGEDWVPLSVRRMSRDLCMSTQTVLTAVRGLETYGYMRTRHKNKRDREAVLFANPLQ